jgi:hypothetical protein
MTGLSVSAEYTVQKTVSGIPRMVVAGVKPIVINSVIFVNLFATITVQTAQSES